MGGLSFLIVDDDTLVRRALRQMLNRYGACIEAPSRATAERELSKEWDGFLIDVRLGDGSGLDFLANLRGRGIAAPAVVLSGAMDHETVNSAATLDARFVSKPCGSSELAPFVAEAVRRKTHDRAHAICEQARQRWNLSSREVEILELAVRGKTRADYIEETGIAHNTFKTHVRRLLQKTDYTNLSLLAIDLLNQH
ncbi:MAG: response regulator transcription factor [Labilithrix sp.]|nr:response regulator transcription factor [Labilithrix sp.]MCW5817800.1 response regulator transcription factor [Labilithrix sp.]